jgi:hypothetical protein
VYLGNTDLRGGLLPKLIFDSLCTVGFSIINHITLARHFI